MWINFLLVFFISVLVIYLPGYFALRVFDFSWLKSLCLAPVVSISCYTLSAIVYGYLNIFSSWLTVFLPWAIFFIALYLIHAIRTRNTMRAAGSVCVVLPLVYVGFALLVSVSFFIKPLDGPMSFCQGPDNTAHLSYIQAFVNSGCYSPLKASFYGDVLNEYADPIANDNGGFYPAAWHILVAIVCSLLQCEVAVAVNASLLGFMALVLPLSFLYFLHVIFPEQRSILYCGALIPLAFEAFPWRFLLFGPLYSNLSAFCIVPAVIAICYRLLCGKNVGRLKECILLLASVFSLVFLQTNAVFTVAVLVAPLLVREAYNFGRKVSCDRSVAVPLFCGAAACALIIAMWVYVHDLPFMAGVVSYPWDPFGSLRQEFINILMISYKDSPVQPLLAVAVLVGILTLLKKSGWRWLLWSYALCCALCICAATSFGDTRSLLIGFWYTDSYRIAAMAALGAMPIAVVGMSAIFGWFSKLISKRFVFGRRLPFLIFAALFTLLNFYPSFSVNGFGWVETAFGVVEKEWYETNHNGDNCVLDYDEQQFLAEVKNVVGDSLVLNKPDDGSTFAYGAFDINTFYRRTGLEADNTDTSESKLVRNSLCNISSDNAVKDAVRNMGAKYLLVLDQGDDESNNRYWYDHYCRSSWAGIDGVTDETVGFEVVLSSEDMRLYKIDVN